MGEPRQAPRRRASGPASPACFRARLAGVPSPAGERTARVWAPLHGRDAAERGERPSLVRRRRRGRRRRGPQVSRWPLTPRDPTREPNGRILWFGAALDADGSQWVWFRITAEAVGRMREKTPRRGRPRSPAADGPPRRRGLPLSPNHPPGVTPGRSAASTPGSTAGGLEDATLADYLADLHDLGRAPASASTAVGRGVLVGPPRP